MQGKIGRKFIKDMENIHNSQVIIIFLRLNFFPVFFQIEFIPPGGGRFWLKYLPLYLIYLPIRGFEFILEFRLKSVYPPLKLCSDCLWIMLLLKFEFAFYRFPKAHDTHKTDCYLRIRSCDFINFPRWFYVILFRQLNCLSFKSFCFFVVEDEPLNSYLPFELCVESLKAILVFYLSNGF